MTTLDQLADRDVPNAIRDALLDKIESFHDWVGKWEIHHVTKERGRFPLFAFPVDVSAIVRRILPQTPVSPTPRRLSGMSRKATLARDLLGWFLL